MRIEVQGLELTQGQLIGVEDRLAHLDPYFETVARNLDEHREEMFETKGRVAGRPWRRLARSTLDARARGLGYYGEKPGSGTSPLKWSGELERSFRVQRMGSNELVWGTKDPRGNLLLGKRPVIKFKNKQQEQDVIVEPLEEHIQAGVTQRGRVVRRRRRR